MHEFGIIHSVFKILEDIANKNNLKSIDKVTLSIGKLRQITPEFLQFAFDSVSQDTIAANAKLIIEEIPIKMGCKLCNQEFVVTRNTYICPKCGEAGIEVLTGKEILIKSVEGEAPDAN